MLKLKVLAMTLVTVAVGTASAAESAGSEFFFQAPANTSALTPHIGYQNFTFKTKGATQDSTLSGLYRLGASYEYGLNEMLALGADVSYTSEELDAGGTTKPKVSGLQDPVVYLKGTTPMDMFRLRYGATLGLGFSKSKVESNGDMNVASGGFGLTPYIGADMDLGPGILGARLSYAFNFERTNDSAGTEEKLSGGDVLSVAAFYEYMLSDMILGGDFEFRSVGEQTTKVNGVETAKTKSFSPLGIDLYARIPVAGFDLIPALSYDFSAGGDRFDKYNDMALTVAGRWLF